MKIIRNLLYPVGILYGCAVAAVRGLYALGWRKSVRFQRPIVLKVGNLSSGGTGKTPHTIAISELLRTRYAVGVLSRGYGRRTRGFRWVEPTDSAAQVGDEPLLMAERLAGLPVAVCEARAEGLRQMLKRFPLLDVAVLDDAMQHWSLEAHAEILLTSFQRPFFADLPLPAGDLREFRGGYRRAAWLVVTKCPDELTEAQRADFLQRLCPLPHQRVFFTGLRYGLPYAGFAPSCWLDAEALRGAAVLGFAGIADESGLKNFLAPRCCLLVFRKFADHHAFSAADVAALLRQWEELPAPRFLLTTEKDLPKLRPLEAAFGEHRLALFVLPISVRWLYPTEEVVQTELEKLIHNEK